MTVELKNNRIYHYDENRKLKEHFAFSTDFSQFEVLKDGRILIMEKYYKYENGNNSNLYCVNQDLEIEWFAEIGKSEEGLDVYVGISTNGNKVYANTWNCFRNEIDIETGKIKSSVFTK
jgi:hypothetical protein